MTTLIMFIYFYIMYVWLEEWDLQINKGDRLRFMFWLITFDFGTILLWWYWLSKAWGTKIY